MTEHEHPRPGPGLAMVRGHGVFSSALRRLGLLGAPRRTMPGAAPYVTAEWKAILPLVGAGGVLLTLSAGLYFANLLLTALASREPPPPAFAEALSAPEHAPAVLGRWRPWLVPAVVLVVAAYGPNLVRLAATPSLATPGLRAG